MKLKYIVLMMTGLSLNSYAFDLEDYNTTRRATRDAFLLAQTDFAQSKNAYDDYKNLLKVNCYQISDASTFSLANLDGLITGACNRDGQNHMLRVGFCQAVEHLNLVINLPESLN